MVDAPMDLVGCLWDAWVLWVLGFAFCLDTVGLVAVTLWVVSSEVPPTTTASRLLLLGLS